MKLKTITRQEYENQCADFRLEKDKLLAHMNKVEVKHGIDSEQADEAHAAWNFLRAQQKRWARSHTIGLLETEVPAGFQKLLTGAAEEAYFMARHVKPYLTIAPRYLEGRIAAADLHAIDMRNGPPARLLWRRVAEQLRAVLAQRSKKPAKTLKADCRAWPRCGCILRGNGAACKAAQFTSPFTLKQSPAIKQELQGTGKIMVIPNPLDSKRALVTRPRAWGKTFGKTQAILSNTNETSSALKRKTPPLRGITWMVKDLRNCSDKLKSRLLRATPVWPCGSEDWMRCAVKDAIKRTVPLGAMQAVMLWKNRTELVGWALIDSVHPDVAKGSAAVCSLYIRAPFRRQGYGTLLLDRAKHESMWPLKVMPCDAQSRAFYTKAGINARQVLKGYRLKSLKSTAKPKRKP